MKSLLVGLILKAKRKVQRERLLKGVAILIAYLLLVSIASAYVLAQENFSDKAILWSRILGLIGFLLILWKGILSPLLKPASLARVSRFLEQRYPNLKDRVSTAVEVRKATLLLAQNLRRIANSCRDSGSPVFGPVPGRSN
jgi:hypothetical protein